MPSVDPTALVVAAAVLGLAVGSFLNVLILRTHAATSPWRGRSKCPQCGHVLAWYELLPLGSFVWLRGRCRHCRASLSWQYPLIEAGTALLFAVVAYHYGMTWWTLSGWVVVSLMVAIAVYDARWSLLPDSFTIALALVGCAVALLSGASWIDVLFGGIGGALFFGLQFLLSRRRWVGSGDVLLGAALGLLLGWKLLALALLLAYVVGAVVASILLLSRRKKASGAIPFGPYLVLGTFIAWLWGPGLIDWYLTHALFR